MIDATHLKAHRTAASRAIGKNERVVGIPCCMPLPVAGETCLAGAAQVRPVIHHALIYKLSKATDLLADRGYDADWFILLVNNL